MYRQAHMHARACESHTRVLYSRVSCSVSLMVSLRSRFHPWHCAAWCARIPLSLLRSDLGVCRPRLHNTSSPRSCLLFGPGARRQRAARATSAQTANATPRVRSRATHLEQPLLLLAAHFLESCLRSKSAALRLFTTEPRAASEPPENLHGPRITRLLLFRTVHYG